MDQYTWNSQFGFLVFNPFKLLPLLIYVVIFHGFSVCRDPWQRTQVRIGLFPVSLQPQKSINRELFKKEVRAGLSGKLPTPKPPVHPIIKEQ